MTHRDRIRSQVGAVKSETQSLLKRLRNERLDKARQRRPAPQARATAPASSDHQVVAASDRFTAGPGIDRFFSNEPVAPAPAAPPASEIPPPTPAVSKAPATPRRQVQDAGTLIGLEPVIVRGTEGRRQPEPNLTPVDKSGVALPDAPMPPLLPPSHRAAPQRPAPKAANPSPRRPNDAGVKTRRVDPSALGLEPVFGGSVSFSLPMPTLAQAKPQAEAAVSEPVAPAEPAPAPRSRAPSMPEVRVAASPLALSTIAAIGPGLAWKLQNLGVLTLGDLAAADPDTLRAGLGPLGSLVRLDAWIDEAKAHLGGRSG